MNDTELNKHIEDAKAPLQSLRSAHKHGNNLSHAVGKYLKAIDEEFYEAAHQFTAEEDAVIKYLFNRIQLEELTDAFGCQMSSLVNRALVLGVCKHGQLNAYDVCSLVKCLEIGHSIEDINETFGIQMPDEPLIITPNESKLGRELSNKSAPKHDNQGSLL